jgi:Na+/H+-translocating membrane pyrophosphatase
MNIIGNLNAWLYFGIFAGLVSVGIAIYIYYWVVRQDPGSARAQEVAGWIRDGANAYLKKLYSALTALAVIISIIMAIVFSIDRAALASETGYSHRDGYCFCARSPLLCYGRLSWHACGG